MFAQKSLISGWQLGKEGDYIFIFESEKNQKGAVEFTAEKLQCSQASVYRYLSIVKKAEAKKEERKG